MTAALETSGSASSTAGVGRCSDCTLTIPPGRSSGSSGRTARARPRCCISPSGCLRRPSGTISVLGGRPATDRRSSRRVGFVAQDTPTYAGLSVAKHLRMGAWLNPTWDGDSPSAGSSSSVSTHGSGPARCPAVSAPSSP